MCLVICEYCRDWISSAPCYFHLKPDVFKKEHPRLFVKYKRNHELAKKNHKCKIENIKWVVEYLRKELKEMRDKQDLTANNKGSACAHCSKKEKISGDDE